MKVKVWSRNEDLYYDHFMRMNEKLGKVHICMYVQFDFIQVETEG